METTKIKRFSLIKMSDRYGPSWMSMTEHQRGEWVRWDDVERLVMLKPIVFVPEGALIGSLSNKSGTVEWIEKEPNETPP